MEIEPRIATSPRMDFKTVKGKQGRIVKALEEIIFLVFVDNSDAMFW